MSAAPTAPTSCRPQHLDRERLRLLLATDDFANVRYHEAVVVVDGAPAFKLLAVTHDALLLAPLGGGSASCTRVAFRAVRSVERASPTLAKLRGVMIYPHSELFEIVASGCATTERRVFVATFEPQSRAFFYVARALHVVFQRRILLAREDEGGDDADADALALGDLHDLLEDLTAEFAHTDGSQLPARCALLDELAAAVTRSHALQRLCFQDQSELPSAVDPISGRDGDGVAFGVVPFLVDELTRLAGGDDGATTGDDARLAYHVSLLQLLHRLLFGGHCVPERLRVFLRTPLAQWTRLATCVPTAPPQSKSDAWRVLREDLLDLQAAVVLELRLLQEEAALLDDAAYVEHHASVADALPAPARDRWVAQLCKRVAVLVSRAPREHAAAAAAPGGGSPWSLALWRGTSLLLAVLRAASSQSRPRVAAMLRQTRRDYIDLCLRNPRFGCVLAASAVPHVVDAAHGLAEILDLLS